MNEVIAQIKPLNFIDVIQLLNKLIIHDFIEGNN
jgi:hypothetical protein